MQKGARVEETLMSPFTTARCQEIKPKSNKLRNNNVLLRSIQVFTCMREKTKQILKWMSTDSKIEGRGEGDFCCVLNLWLLSLNYVHVLLFENMN